MESKIILTYNNTIPMNIELVSENYYKVTYRNFFSVLVTVDGSIGTLPIIGDIEGDYPEEFYQAIFQAVKHYNYRSNTE